MKNDTVYDNDDSTPYRNCTELTNYMSLYYYAGCLTATFTTKKGISGEAIV